MAPHHEWLDYDPKGQFGFSQGWYAVMFSYDANEGAFVKALFFDGIEFSEPLPIYRVSNNAFISEDDAQAWAEKNEPCF